MAYYVSFILLFLNSLFTFGRKHSKILTILLISFLWILFWGNYQNPDYNNYLRNYNWIAFSGDTIFNSIGSEFGFRFLMKIVSYCKVNYTVFVVIISFIGFLLIYSTVIKFTRNTNYVFVFYFFTPFFLDVVQVRNFLAMSIMIFSIRYLFIEQKKGKIMYILAILLATTIHYSSILYLPMIFISKTNKKKMIKLIVAVSVLGSIIILLGNNFWPVIGDSICKILNIEKANIWFENRTRFGYLLFFGMQAMSFLMIRIARKNVNRNLKDGDDSQISTTTVTYEQNGYKFIELLYWINIFAFAFFPLYILDSTFTRLMRNLLLLNYIGFSFTSDSFKRGSNNKILFNFGVVIYVVVLFLIQIYIPFKDNVLGAILKNNLIFK